MRSDGITVNDVPMHLSLLDQAMAHSIIIPDLDLVLPLQIDVVISYLPVRMPTDD
jgi:hypothetical protein